jgi:hypothetical protein
MNAVSGGYSLHDGHGLSSQYRENILTISNFPFQTDILQIPEAVEAMIGPLSFLGNHNRAPRAQQAVRNGRSIALRR